MSSHKYKLIDLFAGCGGLSLGLEKAGFESIFFNEIISTYALTYSFNRPNLPKSHGYIGDINKLNEVIANYEHIWGTQLLPTGIFSTITPDLGSSSP